MAAGCKKEPPPIEESIAKYGAAVEARLKQAEAAGARLSQTKATGAIVLDGPPLAMEGRYTEDHKRLEGNATLLVAEDLADLMRIRPSPFVYHDGQLQACATILRNHEVVLLEADDHHEGEVIPASAFHFADDLPACARLKYLVVARIDKKDSPLAFQEGSFMAGHVSGDVLVFDLENGRALGGVPFRAESSSSIQVTVRKNDRAGGMFAADREAKRDLKEANQRAIKEAIHKALPDALLD
jgi:hypothetical protein